MKTFRQFLLSLTALFLLPFTLLAADPSLSAVFVQYGESRGSGTVVAKEGKFALVLTCAHVVPDSTKATFVVHKGVKYTATYLAGSKVTEKQIAPKVIQLTIDGPDLALLVVEANLTPADLATDPPEEGDRLRQWGFAGGDYSKGPIYKTGEVVDPLHLTATLDARPGDSGSGLWNDQDQLVGVTHSRPFADDEEGVVATPLSTVTKFLKVNREGFRKFTEPKTITPAPQFQEMWIQDRYGRWCRVWVQVNSPQVTPSPCPNGKCPLQK